MMGEIDVLIEFHGCVTTPDIAPAGNHSNEAYIFLPGCSQEESYSTTS